MKKKNKKNIKRLILMLFAIAAIYISLKSNREYSKIEESLKDVTSLVNRVVIYSVNAVSNKKTSDQTESYLIQKNVNSALEKEIQELKEVLELNSTLTEYGKENATVISRNNSYWFNNITIDKGKKDGVKKGMAVITKSGLVGKISKVSQKSSEVKLLTSDDITYKTSVTIRINEKDNYAILNGYEEKANLLKVSAVDKSTEVNKGDIVLTSGLGEIPQGIYVGTVEKSEIDQYNLSKIIYIKPSQDYNNIQYVTVLKEHK